MTFLTYCQSLCFDNLKVELLVYGGRSLTSIIILSLSMKFSLLVSGVYFLGRGGDGTFGFCDDS